MGKTRLGFYFKIISIKGRRFFEVNTNLENCDLENHHSWKDEKRSKFQLTTAALGWKVLRPSFWRKHYPGNLLVTSDVFLVVSLYYWGKTLLSNHRKVFRIWDNFLRFWVFSVNFRNSASLEFSKNSMVTESKNNEKLTRTIEVAIKNWWEKLQGEMFM